MASCILQALCLILQGFALMPTAPYGVAFLGYFLILFYTSFEVHLFEDALTLFRGSPVHLSYNPSSHIYRDLVSKCRLLHGRYLATPWLASPHLQTTFMNFVGRTPAVNYKRQIFHASDGGTFALDWVKGSNVSRDLADGASASATHDKTPIVVVIPGLTSDSDAPYIRHLVFDSAKRGWNVVVCNHRGLGGISITSDCIYNAGWTKDTRDVIDYLHHEYPNAPLFAVGTSIGANILVKYLGEDGENVPVAGAVAVCSPWDLLINTRFIRRRRVQRFYDRFLALGLQDYARLHQPVFARIADWEGITKSFSIRDFDHYVTRLIGKYESVDTFYRHASSTPFVGKVSVPLLSISSFDDPICTAEAIPWDECRENKNVVLATTRHGGHVAFYEGLTASTLWWVRAANEFLGILHGSPFMHTQKKNPTQSRLESPIDKDPYVNISKGMVAPISNNPLLTHIVEDPSKSRDSVVPDAENCTSPCSMGQTSKQMENIEGSKQLHDLTNIIKWLDELLRQNKRLMWMLAYISVVSTLPVMGAALRFLFMKKFKKFVAAKALKL